LIKIWRRRNKTRPVLERPDLVAWAQAVNASMLSADTVKEAEDFLRQYDRLNIRTRREFSFRLVAQIERQVSPPPPLSLRPLDIISTALEARRRQLGIG
jgi:hypothetical protein